MPIELPSLKNEKRKTVFRKIFYFSILFILIFCFGLLLKLNSFNFAAKKVETQPGGDTKIQSKQVLNSEGYNDKKYSVLFKIPLEGIVTSTIFDVMEDMMYHVGTYSLVYYRADKKGWYKYDIKSKKEEFLLAEENTPISTEDYYGDEDNSEFKIFYTVFENGNWLVKSLDVKAGKITWTYNLGKASVYDKPTDNFISLLYLGTDRTARTLLVHIHKTFDFSRFFYSEGEYNSEQTKDCERAKEDTCKEALLAGDNSLSALDPKTGQLIWKFSTDVGSWNGLDVSFIESVPSVFDFYIDYFYGYYLGYYSGDLKTSNLLGTEEKSVVIIYPPNSDNIGQPGKIVNKIFILDLKTGKKLYSLQKSFIVKNCFPEESIPNFISVLPISNHILGLLVRSQDCWGNSVFSLLNVDIDKDKQLSSVDANFDKVFPFEHGYIGWKNYPETMVQFSAVNYDDTNQDRFKIIRKNEYEQLMQTINYNSYHQRGGEDFSPDFKFIATISEPSPSYAGGVYYESGELYLNDKTMELYGFVVKRY